MTTARKGRFGHFLVRGFAIWGALSLALLGWGVLRDGTDFDRTRGGYESPFEGWTGQPIDFAAAYRTATGLYGPGRVVATHLDCRTGMVSLIAFGVWVDWRVVPPRAIAVHHPREACRARGFDPAF